MFLCLCMLYPALREIHQLLNVSLAHGSSDEHMLNLKESYILLVNVNVTESQSAWSGKTVTIQTSAETTINLSELQVSWSNWYQHFHTQCGVASMLCAPQCWTLGGDKGQSKILPPPYHH